MLSSANKFHISIAVIVGVLLGFAGTYFVMSSQHSSQYESLFEQNSSELERVTKFYESKLSEKNAALINTLERYKVEVETLHQQLKFYESKLSEKNVAQEKVKMASNQQLAQAKPVNRPTSAQVKQQNGPQNEENQKLFDRQKTLSDEIQKLSITQSKLTIQLSKLSDACDLYKKGTSWDVKSDSCSNTKLATEQLKKLDKSLMTKTKELDVLNALIKN